jgi:hypothetical protein
MWRYVRWCYRCGRRTNHGRRYRDGWQQEVCQACGKVNAERERPAPQPLGATLRRRACA